MHQNLATNGVEMRIAVTADVHLVAGDNGHPERLAALRDILEQLPTLEIDRLIIAGDLFDRDLQAYGEFETLCNEFPEISIEIIPGNHDPSLAPEHLLTPNITVYSEPQLVDRDGRQLLFVPYAEGTKMGEVIDRFRGELSAGRWILVGHGNYGGGLSTPHPHEPGVYMPLSRRDIDHSEPALVLLGHIHVPTTQPPVHYPGSPCGLDISETGPRRFLILDTNDGSVASQPIQSEVVFFAERFVVLPTEDEAERLRTEISRRIESWPIDSEMWDRVQVRIDAVGYCENRETIRDVLQQGFAEFQCHDGTPRLNNLHVDQNPQLIALAGRVRDEIDRIDWNWSDDEPEREDALLAALAILYGTEPAS